MVESIDKRTGWRRPAAGAALLVLALGCTSTGGRQGAPPAGNDPPSGAVSSTQVRVPAEIHALELTARGGVASLEVMADRPLVWTSFRDADDALVIELPNSVPGAAVEGLERADGLVASIEVERLDDAARPLTRLVVRTREPSEHSLAGEGETLRLQLVPVGGAPESVALAYEPLPEEDLAAEKVAVAPPVVSQPPSADAAGTPEAPHVGPPPTGVAASQLYTIDVLSTDSGTVIQVAGDGEFAYSTFRLENPERFVIDLAGVVNSASSPTVSVDSREVDRVRIGQFKPRPDPVSRVVFDLHYAVAPRVVRTADGLTVSFGASVSSDAGVPGQESTLAQDLEQEELPELEGEPGFVEAEIEEAPVVVAQQIEEPPPAAPEPAMPEPEPAMPEPEPAMPEPPPAAPPAVPVYQPTAEPLPSGEAMRVAEEDSAPSVSRPVGTSDVSLFEAQQVQIEPTADEHREAILNSFSTLVVNRQERTYVGEPIDMSLKQADLVETLRSFATISDLNFVIQPGVRGSVTVELKGVPWDQAMEQILKINNLGMDIDGTIVRIAPMSQLRAEAEEQRRLAKARQHTVPLQTVLKALSYSRANEVATLLRNRTGSILSSRGTVQVDNRTNTLIIRELPEAIDVVLAVIENLDAPEPQVTIEARIVEATKSFSRSLGIEWGYDALASAATGNTTGLQFPNNYTVDGGFGLLTGGANGFLDITMGNILNTFNLDARLQAAENEGLVNLVSAPRVTTLNNTAASIQSGFQLPIQTVSNRTVSVQFVNATLQLQVTPQVTAEGTIMMDINVAKRSPAPGLVIVGASNTPIQTREARTKVIVRDGGTAVIGGIYEVSANQSQDRIPGLANIPILGHLFKNRNRSDSNDELMIFITPRIVQM